MDNKEHIDIGWADTAYELYKLQASVKNILIRLERLENIATKNEVKLGGIPQKIQ